MKFIVIQGEIKVENQNMGYVYSRNEKNRPSFFDVVAMVKNSQVTALIFTNKS